MHRKNTKTPHKTKLGGLSIELGLLVSIVSDDVLKASKKSFKYEIIVFFSY